MKEVSTRVSDELEADDNSKETSRLTRNPSLWSCDFETAITEAGFGRFNAYLVLVAIFTGLIVVFESRSMAYVVPVAQCDLNLSLEEKAMLNSIPLAGMIVSLVFWGFLGDKFGRKKIIVVMCFLDFICWFTASLSQTFIVLLVARFLGGALSSGIYPSLASYLTETHGVKYRAVMQLLLGNIYGVGDLLLPLLAATVLTSNADYQIESLAIHPWNIYLFICGLPALLSGIGFFVLPESPKFLMSQSRNDKAIEVFQSIYTINMKNSPTEIYPVKSLKYEGTVMSTKPEMHQKNVCLKIISPLIPFLERKYLKNILLALLAQFLILMGLNAILLWLPQIFQQMDNHQRHNNGTATVCETLDDLKIKTNSFKNACDEDMVHNYKSYFACMVVASITILTFFISGYIINRIGKKKLLYILGSMSSVSTLMLMYAENFTHTLILTSIICASGNIGFNALVSVVVDLFPTNLRAMSVSLTMTAGRTGGAFGVFIIPIFVQFTCSSPLIFVSYFNLVWVFVVYMLPDTDQVPLE